MNKIITVIAFTFAILGSAVAQNTPLPQGSHYEAKIETSEGVVKVRLYNETPIHRDNFVTLANANFYNGILFHRVIKDFMIQAGDQSSKEGSQVRTYGNNDAGYKLDAEIRPEYFHKKGVLAAAREGDNVNPEKKSSGSQFYIVVGTVLTDSTMTSMKEKIKARNSWDITPEREQVYRTIGGTPHLDGSYTVFGEVLAGQKVVDKISVTPTYKNDRPKKDIYIKKITVTIAKDKR